MAIAIGFGVSLLGFNLHEDWALPFKIAGPLELIAGAFMVGVRFYMRLPCCPKGNSISSTVSGNHAQMNMRGGGGSGGGVQVVDWTNQQPCSCQHHHPHHPHHPGSPRDPLSGTVVVFSSPGGAGVTSATPHFLTPSSSLPPGLPPQYETLSPPPPPFTAGGPPPAPPPGLENNPTGPPSYVLVSPMSPPPSYIEACNTPKENDGDANPAALHPGAPEGYRPSYDAYPAPGGHPI